MKDIEKYYNAVKKPVKKVVITLVPEDITNQGIDMTEMPRFTVCSWPSTTEEPLPTPPGGDGESPTVAPGGQESSTAAPPVVTAGCTSDEAIPVQKARFTMTDNDDSTSDDVASVFSPGERDNRYQIIIRPLPEEGAEPIIPMSIKTTGGDNVKSIVVHITPKKGRPTILEVRYY